MVCNGGVLHLRIYLRHVARNAVIRRHRSLPGFGGCDAGIVYVASQAAASVKLKFGILAGNLVRIVTREATHLVFRADAASTRVQLFDVASDFNRP